MKQQKMLAYFNVLPLCDVVKEPDWIKALSSFVICVEKNPQSPNPSNKWLIKLYQSLQPLQKVLVLHGLRALIRENFEETEGLDELEFRSSPYEEILRHHSPSQSATSISFSSRAIPLSEQWIPQIAYHIADRVIEVEVDGQILALIKPGRLRQHHDNFLFQFYKKMQLLLALPTVMDNLFLASYECQVPFSYLKPRQPLTDDSELVVSSRGVKGPRFMHIDLRENLSAERSILEGGMQVYLNAPAQRLASEIKTRRTILLLFACMLNCRDLKSDGIIDETIVDCEDWLEFKLGTDPTQLFPKIHVPFSEPLLLEELDLTLLQSVHSKITQLDWSLLEKFIANFTYEIIKTETFKINYVLDKRDLYQDPKPVYVNNQLLSRAQFAVLKNNLEVITTALQQLIQQPQCTVHQLLQLFDPVWAEWRDRYVACFAASTHNKIMEKFFSKEQKPITLEIARFFSKEMPATDWVGALSSRPPSPIGDVWRNRSSPVIFNSETSSSDDLSDQFNLALSH